MRIHLKRPKSKYYDESRYKIFIDGVKVAVLTENQSKEVEVNSETITIESKLVTSWSGSKVLTLSVSEGDIIEFTTNPWFAKVGIILPAVIPLLWGGAYSAENPWIKWLFIGLLIVDLTALFYILVVARRKWININRKQH